MAVDWREVQVVENGCSGCQKIKQEENGTPDHDEDHEHNAHGKSLDQPLFDFLSLQLDPRHPHPYYFTVARFLAHLEIIS
jgi:hypothetical protein